MEALFAVQRPDGVFDFGVTEWESVLSTAGAISGLHAADADRSSELINAGVDWLCRAQKPDGGWSTVPAMPSEAGPTAVASATLYMIAPERTVGAVRAGRAWLDSNGGLDAMPNRMAVLCQHFYAMAGWLDQADLPRLPLELAAFPRLFRRLLDFHAPIVAALALEQVRTRRQNPLRRMLNRLGTPGALRLIRQIYDHEGTGEFADHPWPAGIACGALSRAGVEPDLVALTVDWLRARATPDGSWKMMPLDLQWSSYVVLGLLDAGHGADPRLASTRAMFQRRQQDRPFEAFGCPAGFWSWSSPQGWPDVVTTADVTSVLARLPGGESDVYVTRALRWLHAQQDTRGSWSMCVRDTKVKSCGPCPHTTTQAVEALLHAGTPVTDRRVTEAVRWLLTAQRPDGSFDSVWYRNATSGTSAVLSTLIRCGHADHPVTRRAADWLTRTQLADGSWSTGDGTTTGTVEETAWAVCALLATQGSTAVVERGIIRLLELQRPDGRWPEAPVSEFIRNASRFTHGGLTHGLALRALAAFVDRTAA